MTASRPRRVDYSQEPSNDLVLVDDKHLFPAEGSVPASTEDVRRKVDFARQHLSVAYHVISEVHDRKEYQALGYSTWAAFCQKEFNWSPRQGYRMVKADEVNRVLDKNSLPPVTERIARVVADLSEDAIVVCALEASKIASEKVYVGKAMAHAGKVTAPIMAEARAKHFPDSRPSDYTKPASKAREPAKPSGLVLRKVAMSADMSAMIVMWDEGGKERHLNIPISEVLRCLPKG